MIRCWSAELGVDHWSDLVLIRGCVDQLWCWSGAKPGTIREFGSSAFGLPTTSLASYSQLIRTWMNAASRTPSKEVVGKCDSRNESALQSNTWANSMTWALLSFSIMSSFQMHLLVCIHGRIISQFETQHSSVSCLVSGICPLANAAERLWLISTNNSGAMQCNAMQCGWPESYCMGKESHGHRKGTSYPT